MRSCLTQPHLAPGRSQAVGTVGAESSGAEGGAGVLAPRAVSGRPAQGGAETSVVAYEARGASRRRRRCVLGGSAGVPVPSGQAVGSRTRPGDRPPPASPGHPVAQGRVHCEVSKVE